VDHPHTIQFHIHLGVHQALIVEDHTAVGLPSFPIVEDPQTLAALGVQTAEIHTVLMALHKDPVADLQIVVLLAVVPQGMAQMDLHMVQVG
jgi:hypothetical protein